VVSSEFAGLLKTLARSQGFADLPVVIVPHPWALHSPEAVRRMADEKFEEIVWQATQRR